MKRALVIIVLAFVAVSYYQKNSNHPFVIGTEEQGAPYRQYEEGVEGNSSQFRCDGRQYCSQMTSRDEAEFFVRNCPDTKMDGDHDGIPCENDSRF